MVRAGGFDNQFDFRFTDCDLAEAARLTNLQDVGAELGDAPGEPREISRTVQYDDLEAAQAAVLNQTLFDDARDQIHIDVAPGHDESDVLAMKADFFIHQGCEGDGRG